jgi:transposase IS66 family protein
MELYAHKPGMAHPARLPAGLAVRGGACAVQVRVRGVQGSVVTASMPVQIDKGRPGAGLLAQVVTAKYADHLPLNRQAEIVARHGVDLSRQTLCD